MTKHILRIVVTVIILGVVGLCLWLFIFKPSDTETAFSVLEEVEEYKDSMLYDAKLSTITAYNNTSCYTSETLLERERIFGGGSRTVGEGTEKSFYLSYNYQKVMKSFDKIYDIYSSYILLAENISKKELNQIKEQVDSYKSAISSVVDKADKVIEYENICLRASETERNSLTGELSNRYTALKDAYKSAFKSYYKLIVTLQSTVKEKTFGGEFVYDAHTSYLDIMLLFDASLIDVPTDNATDVKNDSENKTGLTQEQTALKKACIIADTYSQRNGNGDLAWVDKVGETAASSFLNAYIDISSKYSSEIARVADYRFSFEAINALGTSDLNVGAEGYKASNIDASAVPNIKTILQFCGIISEPAEEGGEE